LGPLGGAAVIGQALRVMSYRFRATFGNRWGGYLSLVLLIGLVGGLAMGAVAAARRTQSSFSVFLASTNPSDLSLGTGLYNPRLGYTKGYDARLVRTIAHLPLVKRAENYAAFYSVPLGPNGLPTRAAFNASYNVFGSLDGLFFNQDRVTVVQGRMASPAKPGEIVMTAGAARNLGLHIGQTLRWGTYANAQTSSSPAGLPHPAVVSTLTLVGTVVLNNGVVQDDIDASSSPTVIFTPALSRRLVACCSNFAFTYLQLEHGSRDVATVEAELERVVPSSLPHDFYDTSISVTKAEHAIKPMAIALGVFGGIAGLAAVVIAVQLIGRQLRGWSGEERVMRALGAGVAMTTGAGLAGILGAVILGALAACAVAVALSPLAPLGPVRPYYPDPGIAFDLAVLGLGFTGLVVVLGAAAVALALRSAPHRAGARAQRAPRHESRIATGAASAGMPVSAVAGIRLALCPPGDQSDAVPVRSAVLGATLAVVVVIATIVFGASLRALVSHPPLYGWNWAYELNGGGGSGTVPQQRAAVLLGRDRQVAAWSGYYFANLQIDGQTVPVLGSTPGEVVAPPVLTGRGFDGPGQIVLGPGTLAQLHKVVGDTVTAGYGTQPPRRLRIVGTATMPVVGTGGLTGHLSMGTGAIVTDQLIPPSVRNQFDLSPPGPNAIFIRLRARAGPAAWRSLERIANELSLPTNHGVTLLAAQRPAEIVNYRSMGTTPAILGLALAAGAVTALGLTLTASVRRRRRDLALLKTFGFTRRQLAATVAWQSSVAVATGVLAGIPLGIVAGRVLWDQFARQIYAVPQPAVPVLLVLVTAAGALALASLVAALPGRIAARTRTALLLRAE
jgi:hypothetical protein